MIFGIVFCVIGFIHGVFKYFVIRSAARDVYNGGGVPVIDFVVFVPLWLSVGASLLLKRFGLYPFPLFGIVAYSVLAGVLYGLMQFEYRRGRPERDRQFRMIKAMNRAEPAVQPNGVSATPADNSGVTEGPPSVR
jgi:hypothetical protein